jgi:hypothetical protein
VTGLEIDPPLIAPPESGGPLTNEDVLLGPRLDPETRLATFSDVEWEVFVGEWVTGLKQYKKVRRVGGAGDEGRDVIGCVGESSASDPWDNFQCKHYNDKLAPTHVYGEVGKFLYHTWRGDYTVPRSYYFVSPRGVGPKLHGLLENPAEFMTELVANWQKHCENSITSTAAVRLDGSLEEWVQRFDFSIFKDVAPHELIETHRQTPYFVPRFGGGLLRPRVSLEVPEAPSAIETRYVQQLLDAYTDHLKCDPLRIEHLDKHDKMQDHLRRQRKHFYEAESLRNFSRDNLPEEGRHFESLQDELFDGIIETVNSPHSSGFDRVNKVLEVAQAIQITSHPLLSQVHVGDRHGICHQLANEDRVKWVE